MPNKLKIYTFPIDHWFDSQQDIEQYRKIFFPQYNQPIPTASPPINTTESKTLWIDEAVVYLGLVLCKV